MTMQTCYMCDKPATSKEHIPPKCLFTKKKDIPKGSDYRKDLISVPSCDEHNSQKSKDDEYLLLVIGMHYENNLDAQRHFAHSIKRALSRNPKLFGIYKNLRPVNAGQNIGAFFEVDKLRFENELRKIIRGLYFHIYKEKWLGEVRLMNNGLKMRNYEHFLDSAEYNAILIHGFQQVRQFMSKHKKYGANPNIFYYQHEVTEGMEVLRLVFYEGFEVVALLDK